MKVIFLFSLFHIVSLVVAMIFLDSLKNLESPIFYLFWLISVTSFLLPIKISYSDPGFISYESSHKHKKTAHIMVVPEILDQTILDQSKRVEHLDAINSFNGSSSEEEKVDPSIDSNPVAIEEAKENESTDVDIYTKYCTTCHINQPIRAKHCIKCNRCVATYDHHCPYLGTCIGEKNRHLFLAFILAQSLESSLLCLVCSIEIDSVSIVNNIDNISIGALSMLVFLYSFSLLLCHSTLAIKNLTTYEVLRWDKIAYLHSHKKCQSPFSKQCKSNLNDYCCPEDSRKEWKL